MHELFGRVDLAPVPVRNKAHDVLKRSIIEGKLAPGQRLIESQIAEGLSISRTPLREAILRLEAEGFLERGATGAVRVKPLSVAEVQELYAVRSVLEGLAAREAAGRLSEAQLERLTSIVQDIKAADDSDVRRLPRLGEQFHQIILEVSGNQTCANLLRLLQDRIDHYRHLTITVPGRGRAAARELVALLKLLRRRDPQGAERAMRQHVLRAGQCMIQQLNGGELGRGGQHDGAGRTAARTRRLALKENR